MTDNVYKKQIGGNHYSMPIQPAEFINKNNIPFAEGNAIKYLCRHKKRGQKQDLEKAIHYLEMILERDYSRGAHKFPYSHHKPNGSCRMN